LLGLGTHTERQSRLTGTKVYEESVAFKEDVTKWYRDQKRFHSNNSLTAKEIVAGNRIHAEFWRVWGNDNPRAKAIVKSLMLKDMKAGDAPMFKSLSKVMGFMPPEETKQLIINSPLDPKVKQTLLNELEYLRQRREED